MQKRKKDFMMLGDAQSANETFQGVHQKKSCKKSKARPTSSCERHTIRSRHRAPPCGLKRGGIGGGRKARKRGKGKGREPLPLSPLPPPFLPFSLSPTPFDAWYAGQCCAINRADHGRVCDSRGWKMNNWISIILYSLLFSLNYSLFIFNFSVIFIIHFLFFISVFLFKFPFCVLQTKEEELR